MFGAPGVVLKGLSEAFERPGVVLTVLAVLVVSVRVVLVEAPSEAFEGPGFVLAVLVVLVVSVVLVEAPSEALESPGVVLEGTSEKFDIE